MATTYKIGEAATLLNLKTYVLRFWETEFPDIVPLRTDKGQRLYTEENLALLERIRFLLHERGLTIEGARKALLEDKEKGLVYTFSPGMNVRPVTAEDESAAGGLEAEGSPEAEGGPEAEGEDEPGAERLVTVVRNMGGAVALDEDIRLAGDDGTAVKKFFSQYNLPGISKTYPIYDPPLSERQKPPYSDVSSQTAPLKFASAEASGGSGEIFSEGRDEPAARSGELPDASGGRANDAGGEDFAYLLESVLSRHKSDTTVFLRELTAELEAIAGLLRDEPYGNTE